MNTALKLVNSIMSQKKKVLMVCLGILKKQLSIESDTISILSFIISILKLLRKQLSFSNSRSSIFGGNKKLKSS